MTIRQTETRTADDLRVQIELERMLAARRARDAAREARYRRLPTPRSQFRAAAKAPMTDIRPEPAAPLPVRPRMTARQIIAAALVWALFFAGALWLAAHDAGYLSRAVERVIGGAA